MSYQFKAYESRSEAFGALETIITNDLQTALANQERASILLSGGSTPGPLFDRLATADLDWKRLVVSLTDDRWVDADDEASNERLVYQTMMKGAGKAATFVPLKADGDTPFDGLDAVRAGLDGLPLPLDVVIMGMGADGHCASLFPESPDLQDALTSDELCWPMRRGEGELARMSLTKSALLNAKSIILLFFGEEKRRVLEEAGKAVNDLLPVSHFLCQDQTPITVYWAP